MAPQEQLSERICEQVVDVPVPQVDVQDFLVPPLTGVAQCTPQDAPTGETDLMGQKLVIVATD